MGKKYKLYANIDIDNEIIEVFGDLSDEELEDEMWEIVKDRMDWGYEEIEE